MDFLIVFLNISLAVVIADVIGRKRKIGILWSLFFSLTFSVLIGLIITLSSRKTSDQYGFVPITQTNWGKGFRIFRALIIILIGIFLIFNNSELREQQKIQFIFFGIGFIGWGIYSLLNKPVVVVEIDEQNGSWLSKTKKESTINESVAKPFKPSLLEMKMKLSTSIPLFYLSLSNKQKVEFLNNFLQLKHNNHYHNGFYEVFPKFQYNPETNDEQIRNFVEDEENFIYGGIETKREMLFSFFKTIDNVSEMFRMMSVIYAVKGDVNNSEKMLINSKKTFKAEELPEHYTYLMWLTELKLLVLNEKFDELAETAIYYKEKIEALSDNPDNILVKQRLEEFLF